MQNSIWKIIVLSLSFIFAILFYKHLVGLNFLLFNTVIIGLTIFKFKVKNKRVLLLVMINLLMACMVVLNGSFVAKFMAWISLFIAIGSILFPSIKSLLRTIFSWCGNTIISIPLFFRKNQEGKGGIRIFKTIKIILIPILIIVVFILFYKSANPVFNKYINSIFEHFSTFFKKFNLQFILWYLLGFILSILLILTHSSKWKVVSDRENSKTDTLIRKRIRHYFSSFIGLKMEYKSALFLFASLNLILFFFNITDVYHLWFNFNWDGGFLKAFVHEGTYLLIVSLLLSIVVTLLYFRRNLNFLQNNKLLKILAVFWLSQNLFMLISVGLRNYHYIEHFALAHKRIGVYFFLAICAAGLISCIIKVWRVKSFHYLERVNAFSVYLILIGMACVNWDIVIAKYNFSNYNKSFLHLPYMLGLSEKALPYIDYTDEQLEKMDDVQNKKFGYEERGYHKKVDYKKRLENKKSKFIEEYEKRHWISWNYADFKAYEKLKNKSYD